MFSVRASHGFQPMVSSHLGTRTLSEVLGEAQQISHIVRVMEKATFMNRFQIILSKPRIWMWSKNAFQALKHKVPSLSLVPLKGN